jgi:hypothetical protein
LAAGPFTPTAERAEVVHFNYCFAQDPLGVLIPAPSEGSQLAAIAKPFQTEVCKKKNFRLYSLNYGNKSFLITFS